MLSLTLKAAKSNFFDRNKVKDAMTAAAHRVLSRFGAYVRQRAKTSLRYRERSSLPGNPPSAHRTMLRRRTNKKTGTRTVQAVSPLRELILFAYDSTRHSVVIGPALLRAGSKVPSVLEYGGVGEVRDPITRRVRKATFAPRPYMRPAFDEELKLLPPNWRDIIK